MSPGLLPLLGEVMDLTMAILSSTILLSIPSNYNLPCVPIVPYDLGRLCFVKIKLISLNALQVRSSVISMWYVSHAVV